MAPLHDFEYSPWLTANLTLEHLPDSYGTDPTWDTVFMDSPTLGYVDATHQSVRSRVDRTVWTFYWALADGPPSDNRAMLLEKDWNYWKEAILHDLERVHPDIRSCMSRIDIMRLGHAMARPLPGAIFSSERRNLAKVDGRMLFANSDLSGFSIFEEAQYRGVTAADGILRRTSWPLKPTQEFHYIRCNLISFGQGRNRALEFRLLTASSSSVADCLDTSIPFRQYVLGLACSKLTVQHAYKHLFLGRLSMGAPS